MISGAPPSLVASRYRLASELGRGASSRVFLAHDAAGGGGPVALKLFGGPMAAASAEAWARFRREAEALSGLDHANIVRVFALGDHEGAPYLTMELVEGGSLESELAARAESGRLPSSDEVGRWLLGAARGLAFAHARGVVHRDLKPANLLLDARGGGSEIKIADFGVAMLAGADEPSRAWVVGTPAYMAPEQCYAIDADVDERSDLFALGVVAYELLTGRRPFRAATLAQYTRELATARPEPPGRLLPGVDPMLEAIALRLLRIRPDERYQTARGLSHDLERWARHGLGVVFELGSRDGRGALAGKAPLVGRDAEFGRLESAWERARGGDGGALWVEGAAGAGKTRLLEALGPMVLGAGGRLVRGKNYELVTPSPFRALADAVRDLIGQLELGPEEERQDAEGRLRRALDGRADLLVRILPELASLLGSARAGRAPLAPEGGSFLLRDAFALLFTGLASTERPLALVVDDAQWSDDDSLAVLRALGRAAAGHAMLLVVARRRGEGPAAEAPPPGARPATIELAPLGPAEVGDLVRGLLGPGSLAAARAATAWVAPRAAGNPLFVRELVLGLVAGGALSCANEGGWAFDEARAAEAEPPPNVSGALVRRAALAGEVAGEVLGAAAVVGPVVPFEVLRALCPDRPLGAVVEALDEACRYALLGRGAGGEYFFTSEEARGAFYERAGPVERAGLHRTLLGRYEAARSAGERVPASELVRHALALADAARVARYAREAAREAEAVYAHQSAVRYYELAIASSPPAGRPPLLVALAEALLSAGRYDEAAAAAGRALASSPEGPAVWSVLASAHFARGRYAEATEALERALAARGRPSPRSRWALARQALAAWAPGPPAAPAAADDDEVEVLDTLATFYFFTDTFTFVATLLAAYRRLRDDPRPDARMWASASFAVLAHLLGLRALARAACASAEALEPQASPEGLARTLTKLALYHQIRHASDEGLDAARRAADACRRVGDLWGLASSLDMQASMRFARGDLAGAARAADRLLDVVDEYDIRQRRPRALQLTAYFGFLLGRVEGGASFEQLARSRRLAASLGDDLTEAAGAWMEADLALLSGDVDRALDLCRRGHRLLREQPRLHPDASFVEATYVRALVRAGLGRRPARTELARLLALVGRALAVGAWFPALLGVGRGARALVAALAAPDSPRARARWDEACAALGGQGDLVRLAYLYVDRALLRRAAGDAAWGADRDDAVALLSRAGAEGAVRALAPLADPAPAPAPAPPRSTDDPTLAMPRHPPASTAELARELEERERSGEPATLRALVTQVSRRGQKLSAAVLRRGPLR